MEARAGVGVLLDRRLLSRRGKRRRGAEELSTGLRLAPVAHQKQPGRSRGQVRPGVGLSVFRDSFPAKGRSRCRGSEFPRRLQLAQGSSRTRRGQYEVAKGPGLVTRVAWGS